MIWWEKTYSNTAKISQWFRALINLGSNAILLTLNMLDFDNLFQWSWSVMISTTISPGEISLIKASTDFGKPYCALVGPISFLFFCHQFSKPINNIENTIFSGLIFPVFDISQQNSSDVMQSFDCHTWNTKKYSNH